MLDDLRDGTRSTEYYVGIYQDRLLQAAMPQQDRLLSRRERRRLEVDAGAQPNPNPNPKPKPNLDLIPNPNPNPLA